MHAMCAMFHELTAPNACASESFGKTPESMRLLYARSKKKIERQTQKKFYSLYGFHDRRPN